MRFGIFYEHQLPRPWAPDDEHRLLNDALEQVELADRLVIDYRREVEHRLQKRKFPPGDSVLQRGCGKLADGTSPVPQPLTEKR